MTRVLLLYPPLQFASGAFAKPDGSLSLPYLAGSLRRAGYEVSIYDAAVGRDGDDLAGTFQRFEPLPNGLTRVGASDEAIVREAAGYDAIGISSTFTAQHTRALATVRLLREAYPAVSIFVGGVNARYFKSAFLDAGADAACLTEGEGVVVDLLRRPLAEVPGIAWKSGGFVRVNPSPEPVVDLDELPMPAWDLLPLAQYQRVARPHGRGFDGAQPRYAEMMTSRGCPYRCTFCHVSKEQPGDEAGDLGAYRVKSVDRVAEEARTLQGLGVGYVFLEDDSLLAKKARAIRIFEMLAGYGLRLADVNGVNLSHLFRSVSGRLEPDADLLACMAACGFDEVSLPFESGSQRILDQYASKKWSVARTDTAALVRAVKAAGMRASGNYTIGFPDETLDEVKATLRLARDHVAAGVDEVNVFLIVPFPGSVLFDQARAGGYLDEWNPDEMRWFTPVMRNTTVPPEQLKVIRELAWEFLNPAPYVAERRRGAVG